MHDEEWRPEPQSAGALRPPPRYPPTAVGVMTPPPPPRKPRASRYREPSRTRLAALAMLGTLFVAAGPALALAVEGTAAALVGGGSVVLGGSVWWRLARAMRAARVVGTLDRPASPSDRRHRAA